jgi:hypothetical protein
MLLRAPCGLQQVHWRVTPVQPANHRRSMLRTILLTLLALAIALGLGAGSVWYAIKTPEGVGSVTISGWTAYPDMGTPEANPYSKARADYDGQLPLGRAEGLAFVANRDASGAPLRRDCRYLVSGTFAPARIWTVFAVDEMALEIPSGSRMANWLNSQSVLFEPDNSVKISVSGRAQPGNWLPVSGSGPMSLVLTLYDTPAAASTIDPGLPLPRISLAGCDA